MTPCMCSGILGNLCQGKKLKILPNFFHIQSLLLFVRGNDQGLVDNGLNDCILLLQYSTGATYMSTKIT
jgi:hypothetical protein